MKRIIVTLAFSAVAGCSDFPKTWSRNDIEEIAREQAEDLEVVTDTSGLESKVSDHQSELDSLKREVKRLASENRSLRSDIDYLQSTDR